MFIKFILLIFIFSSCICDECPAHCARCQCVTNSLGLENCDGCLECFYGYFLFKEHWYSNPVCKKLCVEGFNQEDCKVCDVGDDRDKCIECHEEYEPSDDRTICQLKFAKCGNKTFENCVKCSRISSSTEYKCDECKYHYILDGYECIYDRNLSRYKSALNIKPKNLMMIIMLIIYFLF